MLSFLLLLPSLLQANFSTEAPHGTGLEWMTIMSVVVPALTVIVLVYLGSKRTV